MAQKFSGEFWRDLKPIAEAFKPDAQPEHYIENAATLDERYYVPFGDGGVSVRPLYISPEKNMWSGVMYAKKAGLVNRHYHPREVFAYTISGQWSYLEHDWVAKAGDFVYETPGSAHTLVAHETGEPMRALFIVHAPLIWLDEDGKTVGYFDVHDYLKMCRDHYEKVGLGAGAIDKLIR